MNRERVDRDRVARQGDEIIVGVTRLVSRDDNSPKERATEVLEPAPRRTERERDVLVALIQPALDVPHCRHGEVQSPAAALGLDDYPYSPAICGHSGNCAGIDPWGFTKQQCVSFVAWRLAQRGISVNGAAYGDAKNWDTVAQSRGYVVNTTPAVGAVAQWRGNETSTWTVGGGTYTSTVSARGHVAFVTAVNGDGAVNVEEYNQNSDQSYHQRFSIKAPRYIHF